MNCEDERKQTEGDEKGPMMQCIVYKFKKFLLWKPKKKGFLHV